MNKPPVYPVKIISIFITILLIIACAIYLNGKVYDFPETKPFSGENIYNPYQDLSNNVIKSNFHAHSIAWQHITNGHNTEKEIFDAYSANGYDVVGISNYHQISSYAKDKSDLYIPVYEHGYNILKSHKLAIGTDKVTFFDYPLFQTTSHKQEIIERIKEMGGLVAIAHPKLRNGHTKEDLEKLCHYEFMEVLNHYRVSDEYWDAALSAGKLVWLLGNDDTHDINKEPTFKIWNITHVKERSSEAVLSALKAGSSYGVKSMNGECDNYLDSCSLINETIKVYLKHPADEIQFIGQNGKIKKSITNNRIGGYTFDSSDTYVRVVVKNIHSSIYLNPFVRYQDKLIFSHVLRPGVNIVQTVMLKLFVVVILMVLLIILLKLVKW